MKEFTGIKDKNGKKIYVGDTVRKKWGWWSDSGYDIRDHEIKKEQKGNKITFLLGSYHNNWTGEEVEKING